MLRAIPDLKESRIKKGCCEMARFRMLEYINLKAKREHEEHAPKKALLAKKQNKKLQARSPQQNSSQERTTKNFAIT